MFRTGTGTSPNGRNLVFPDGDITGQNGRGLVFRTETLQARTAETWCSQTGTLQDRTTEAWCSRTVHARAAEAWCSRTGTLQAQIPARLPTGWHRRLFILLSNTPQIMWCSASPVLFFAVVAFVVCRRRRVIFLRGSVYDGRKGQAL